MGVSDSLDEGDAEVVVVLDRVLTTGPNGADISLIVIYGPLVVQGNREKLLVIFVDCWVQCGCLILC